MKSFFYFLFVGGSRIDFRVIPYKDIKVDVKVARFTSYEFVGVWKCLIPDEDFI